MSKSISRKNFIRNFGLATLTMPGLMAFTAEGEGKGQKGRGSGVNRKSSGAATWETRRGSWVRKGAAQPGDLTLAEGEKGCHITLNPKEGSVVRQAVKFLSGDIGKISGYTPKSGEDTEKGSVNVHVITIGNATVPAEIPVSDLKGK